MSSAQLHREVVAEIYAAFVGKDLGVVNAVADRHFAPDIVLREPESLPYGGVYDGLESVRAVFQGLVDPRSPIDAAQLEVDHLLAYGDHVVAAVRFPWEPPGADRALPMRALEWFTFSGEQVTEIQVFLWDVAACLESLRAAAS